MPFIQYDHKPLFFILRRSKRARRLHIVAKANTFEVVAPHRINIHTILSFVYQQRRWMSKQVKLTTARNKLVDKIWPECFLADEIVPYRAMRLQLTILYGHNKPIEQQEDKLIISLPGHIHCAQIEHEIKKQLFKWYQDKAMSWVQEAITKFCPKLERWPSAVKLKAQKSRWGSCGITQKIYINWLLVVAPPGILEYVVAHELAHLFYRNHGQHFWAKVAYCMPEFAQYDKWLSQHGHSLKLPYGF